jgi:hypothetical protein
LAQQAIAQTFVDQEEHLLAMLLRNPDLLMWLSQAPDALQIGQLCNDDMQHTENREIFRALSRYMNSDEPWDWEIFQESLEHSLNAKLAKLAAYGTQLPLLSEAELHEGLIKDIVHLRLQHLKTESSAVRAGIDEAQRNGDLDVARSLGSVYGRIQRDLDRLQPLKLRENHRGAGWRQSTSALQMQPHERSVKQS